MEIGEMLAVRLPQDLEEKLTALAQATERSKSFYIKKALEFYLQEYADYLMAHSISEKIRHGQEKTYTLEEVEAMLKERDLSRE
jgi:RHH-type rel operon transcriptional repressor/antitoxin RelB